MRVQKVDCKLDRQGKGTQVKFNEILQESIDEALSSLGENVRESIYFHLELNFKIPQKDIPSRIDDFSTALERIFGIGAHHLELLIMKKLHEKTSCLFKWEGPKWLVPDLSFTKYVELIKLFFEDNRRIGEFEVIIDAGQRAEQRR